MSTAHEDTPLNKDSKALSSKKRDDKQALQAREQKASSLHITFNLITCGLGTGVFTLPWSTAGASVVPALLIVALVLALNAWTISVLVEAAERHQTFDIGSLLARLPGRMGQVAQPVCNIVLWFSMFLCLVGYIIVMVDCVESFLGDFSGAKQTHRAVWVMLAAASVLPLCFLDQRRLAFTSFLALAANANIFAFLVSSYSMQEPGTPHPAVCFFGLGPGAVAMMSAMMQVVVIQMCVLPMYAELENRSPAKFNRIVMVSFSVLLFLCTGFAVAGYLTYGPNVSSNVLKNLSGTHWGHFSQLAAACAVAAVFPIIFGSMVAAMKSSEAMARLHDGSPKIVSGIATCCIILGVMGMALMVTDLGFLNIVNGALSMGAFVATVPSLVGLYLLGPRSSNPYWRGLMYTLLTVGLTMAVLGVILSDNYAAALKSACAWPRLS